MDEEQSEESPALPEKTTANWAARGLVVLLLLIVGSALGLYFLKDRIPAISGWAKPDDTRSAPLESKISALQTRLDYQEKALGELEQRPLFPTELTGRLDAVEARLNEQKTDKDMSQSARIDMLLARMSQLEASFVPLSKGLVEAGDAKRAQEKLTRQAEDQAALLADIDVRLKPLEDFAARDMSSALLGLYVSNLGEKLRRGQPFAAELSDIRALIAEGSLSSDAAFQEQLERLSRFAENGIATTHRLEQSFRDMIPGLLAAQNIPDDAGWWIKTLEGFKKLVRLRKTDDFDGRDFDALIAKAEKSLSVFDLEKVLKIVKSLPKSVRILLEDWVLSVTNRLEAEDAVEKLHHRLSREEA